MTSMSFLSCMLQQECQFGLGESVLTSCSQLTNRDGQCIEAPSLLRRIFVQIKVWCHELTPGKLPDATQLPTSMFTN